VVENCISLLLLSLYLFLWHTRQLDVNTGSVWRRKENAIAKSLDKDTGKDLRKIA